MPDDTLLSLTADIVAAHVSNNRLSASELPTLIASVYGALGATVSAPVKPEVAPTPAVSVRSSIKPDHIVCLEDGAKVKMLKRYLRTRFDLTPEQYREKWGLPRDYPMVAPNYAEQRRSLAQAIGLGRKAVTKVEAIVEEAAAPVVAAVKAGRKRLGISVSKATDDAAAAAPIARKPPRARKAKAAPATKS